MLLALPFELRASLTATGLELARVDQREMAGSIKLAIYAAENNLPSGAALIAGDIGFSRVGRLIYQLPIQDGSPGAAALTAADYFAVVMVFGSAPTLVGIDPYTHEVESILGTSAVRDARPVTGLMLPGTPLLPNFAGDEPWQDFRGDGLPVFFINT